ncbi:ABC transporter ATP-binding protein [Candidatus Saccharibacteria bacterium]|nr:ABC transporter ATP-binding protein [Candidatus Saccharibacteria bacterium]
MSAIKTTNLTKTYGKKDTLFTALDNVSIDIQNGEKVAIIGKSGSGKSTLMHIVALLDSPTSGDIEINGKNIADYSTKQIDQLRNDEFGFVFQQFFLNANNSVLDNVTLPLKIAGIKPKSRNQRGLEALRAVGLEDKAKNKANDLSGGQKQRVVIARALINNPKIIFADEPTGNLDSNTGQKIEELLFKLNKEQGITLIVVTHDEDLAKKFDRRINIKDGKITNTTKGAK